MRLKSIPSASAKTLTGIALLAASTLHGCNPAGGSGEAGPLVPGVTPGATDRKGVEEILGKPVSVRRSELEPGSEIVEYAGGATIQLREGKVSLVRKVPRGEEAFVQYWLHRYSGEKTFRRAVQGEGSSEHAAAVEELAVPAIGRTIHFETRTGRVIHVFEYPTAGEGAQ